MSPTPILCVGDSFTARRDDFTEWPERLQERLGAEYTIINRAVHGAGYCAEGINPNPGTFARQLSVEPRRDYALVIVTGSVNDNDWTPDGDPWTRRDTIRLAAFSTLAYSLQLFPNARHLWIGPVWSGPSPCAGRVTRVRDAWLEAAHMLPWQRILDPIAEGWFPPDRPELWRADQFHPSDLGYLHMVNKIEPVARELLGP